MRTDNPTIPPRATTTPRANTCHSLPNPANAPSLAKCAKRTHRPRCHLHASHNIARACQPPPQRARACLRAPITKRAERTHQRSTAAPAPNGTTPRHNPARPRKRKPPRRLPPPPCLPGYLATWLLGVSPHPHARRRKTKPTRCDQIRPNATYTQNANFHPPILPPQPPPPLPSVPPSFNASHSPCTIPRELISQLFERNYA
ncbi:MAG: hypothetical protein JWN40_449 [Phycisphaerales bacterium]|nr:hypothetical protein [Phycisphaerales bacterium]